MNKAGRLRDKFKDAGVVLIIACCFFIPISSSLMGATAILAFLCWIFSGRILSLPSLMMSNTTVLLSVSLFFLLFIGVFYSPADASGAFVTLKKYRELLFLAMVVSLLGDNGRAAQLAENSFVAGCIVLLSLSYGMFFSILPMEKWGYSTVYHITHSFFMAILAFWSLHRAFGSRKYLYLWLLLFVAASINLFYIAPGRTGMLVYGTLLLLTFFQRLPPKKSIPAILLACLLAVVTFSTSPNFSSRVREAVSEIQHYQPASSRSSLGMRFDWWQNSMDLIGQKPIFGHGTGSFKAAQSALIKNSQTESTDNPHNEYFLIAVQSGLVGAVLFIALLAAQFFSSLNLNPAQKYLLQGVVVAMACGCLMNSFLYDSHQGHFYAILSAILCVPDRNTRKYV